MNHHLVERAGRVGKNRSESIVEAGERGQGAFADGHRADAAGVGGDDADDERIETLYRIDVLGIVGGLGIAPGSNLGDELAVFEPVHGSAPKYTGMNKVNPMAMMFSGAMMLRHIGEQSAGDRLEGAIAAVIAEGTSVTYDMKPTPDDPTAVGTSQVADAVIERLKER